MDRREAIINLEAIKDFYGADWKDGYTREFVVLDKEEKEAIDMAIAALQEPGIVRKEGEKKQVTGNQKSVETSTDKADKSTVGQPKSKLKNPCDSLLKPDSDECKEQKSKLECISREWVRAKLDYISYAEKDPISIAKRIVDNAPSVTPTERTGEWVRRKDGGATCSRCGVMLGKGHWTNCDGVPDYYCYNCGAKMKGGTENE